MTDYILSPLASEDIIAIWSHTLTEWGEKQADCYIQELDFCFERLVANPRLGRERQDIKNGYRSVPVGSHLVFYRITSSDIEIIGIPHQREDPKNHIGQESR